MFDQYFPEPEKVLESLVLSTTQIYSVCHRGEKKPTNNHIMILEFKNLQPRCKHTLVKVITELKCYIYSHWKGPKPYNHTCMWA